MLICSSLLVLEMDRPTQAEQLAHLIPRDRLCAGARDAADGSAANHERWLVALSGGADSVALLFLIWAHWPGQRALLRVAHFNHRLRGAESESDQDFCQKLCEELGVVFCTQAWMAAPKSASEEQARGARYSFFESLAEVEHGRVLFTGHQKDDIIETQLMRLARGASSAGLAAPRPRRRWGNHCTLLRPLLGLSRDELQTALRTVGVSWREDSTNVTGLYLRNRIRHSVVTSWLQAAGPGALEGAALTREWLEEDDDALEFTLDRLGVPQLADELNLQLLANQPRSLWRRALRRWRPLGEVTRRAFDELLTACQLGRGRFSLGTGFAVIEGNWLRYAPSAGPLELPWTPARLSEGMVLVLPGGGEITSGPVGVGIELWERFRRGLVDHTREAIVRLPLEEMLVRSWTPGDRYQPLGSPGSAKLQDLFVNRKVPLSLRHRLPVIVRSDGSILWVPGFPPAESSKVTDQCVTAVQLTYTSGTYTVLK